MPDQQLLTDIRLRLQRNELRAVYGVATTMRRVPNVPRLQLLLDIYEQTDDPTLLKIVNHSLTSMARGGIRDHRPRL